MRQLDETDAYMPVKIDQYVDVAVVVLIIAGIRPKYSQLANRVALLQTQKNPRLFVEGACDPVRIS